MELIMYFDIGIRTTLSHYFHKYVHKMEKFIASSKIIAGVRPSKR